LLWITIGINGCNPVVAQECFYSKEVQYKDGSHVTAIERYDCSNSPPPEVIIKVVEKEAKPKTIGDWLFRLEENDSLSHTLSILVNGGIF
jgi:hypothetical protein|tara:strand:+ start:529 stop:798 length:270 start_codon:yes stop_codon:yes gene_type:complete